MVLKETGEGGDNITLSGPGGQNETVERSSLTGNERLWQKPKLRKLLREQIEEEEKKPVRARLPLSTRTGTDHSTDYRSRSLVIAANAMNSRQSSDAATREKRKQTRTKSSSETSEE